MYVPYKSISKNPESSTFVPIELQQAQIQGFSLLKGDTISNWDENIAKSLDLNTEDLWKNFSAEQIDSIGLIQHNFKKNQAFIIADETGIGKGRILAGVCRYAFSQGLKVLFITERENLLSDFYRDLLDTRAIDLTKNIKVLHGTGKVYDPDGNLALKGTLEEVKNLEANGIPEDTNLIITCYSQISLADHKKNRTEMLANYIKDSVIILDESHNATGDSNTKEFLMTLLQKTNKVVFSSATFIKDADQLDLYQRCLNLDKKSVDLFKKILEQDNENTLRKVFTYELTRNLQFWRREHQPLSFGWNSIVIPRTPEQDKIVDTYAKIVNGMFGIIQDMNKDPAFAGLDMLQTWFSHGSTINRMNKNLVLLMKIPTLADEIESQIKMGRKAVVAIDSTFSSIIQKVIEKQAGIKPKPKKSKKSKNSVEEELTDDEQDVVDEKINIKEGTYELNFSKVLEVIIDDVIGTVLQERGASAELILRYQDLMEETAIFKDLFISPIDQLIELLAEKGIKCNEVSGRTSKIVNCNKIQSIKKRPRAHIVKEFNDGVVDAIILTRAGATGISLHASSKFKDQKVRCFFELEITTRPTYRFQFLGRVNRKGQVCEPLFFSVVTQLPFEQRILNMEKQKVAKMQSHVSGDDEKLKQENIYNLYTNFCNKAAEKFLRQTPAFARQMGISLKGDKEDLYYIDNLLKRCIVLTSAQQNVLYDFLLYAIECENILKQNVDLGVSSKVGTITSFWHELTDDDKAQFKARYQNLLVSAINQFYFPWVGLMELKTTYRTKYKMIEKVQDEFAINFEKNDLVRDYMEKAMNAISLSKVYEYGHLINTIIPNIKKINLGSLVSLQNKDGRIFGYIHDVIIPPVGNAGAFSELCLIHLKTVNPVPHNSIHYSKEDYYISLQDLIDSPILSIKNQQINWDMFSRFDREYERTQQCLIGHPIYMEYMRSIYNIGNTVYREIAGKKCMYIILPDTMSAQTIKKLKRPYVKSGEIMDAFIAKKIQGLSTTWQGEEAKILPAMKIEKTVGGYLIRILDDVYKNNDFMDFPLKTKFLKRVTKRGFSNNYHLFHIAFTQLRGVLFLFEMREVVWFADI